MSVVPVRVSDSARASSKFRYPPGTVNIHYGYRLSQQRRTRPNVNLTYDKESRVPEHGKAAHAKDSSNRDKLVAPSEKHSGKNETDEAMRAKGSTGNKERGDAPVDPSSQEKAPGIPPRKEDQSYVETAGEAPLRAKYSVSKKKAGPLLRAKYVAKKKEEQQISVLPGYSKDSNVQTVNAREERELRDFLRTLAFEERTDKRIMKKKFSKLVQEGVKEYEASIDARREKLRSMLLEEEKRLLWEVVDQAQRGAELKIEETRRRAAELRKRTEDLREATVREKRMRQYLEQCPEVRARFVKKTARETKYSNLVQMAENEARREAEREEEALWYDLMVREVEAKKAREVAEERRRLATGKSIAVTLERQMAGKLALQDEEKRMKEKERELVEKLLEEESRESLKNPEKAREKRARLKRELEEQLSVARRYLEERAREEEAMDTAMRILGEAELTRERAATKESTARLREEIAAYMESLAEFREAEERRNAEVEEIVAATARAVAESRDRARRETREKRERLFREVLEGREQQLRDKRASEEEKSKRSAMENESWRKETEAEASLGAETETRRRENALRYGQELKAQQEYAAEMRRREKEADEIMRRENLEREKEREKLAEQTLNAPEIITPHAFKMLLKECENRREAKQKGLCYSSPSFSTKHPCSGYP